MVSRSVAWLTGLLTLLTVPEAGVRPAAASDRYGEPDIVADGDSGAYLHQLHARVHDRWADNFLRLADIKLSISNPLNVSGREAVFRLTLGSDGSLKELVLERSSGFLGFDDAAREVLRDSAPFPPPPAAVLSDDDLVHLHWTLARDRRACSGLQLDRIEEPDDRALPRMLHLGYIDEAVRRTSAASARQGLEAGITLLARSWLREAIKGPFASVRAAELLHARGDGAAGAWLERALARPETAADAAAVLAANHRPLCPLVKPALEGFDQRPRLAAVIALQESHDYACARGLLALLADRSVDAVTRAAAASALGNLPSETTADALESVAYEGDRRVRSAARVAMVRARRPHRYASIAYLMAEGRPEVRFHAAVALARSHTENALAQLALVADEDAAVAVAGILARNAEPEAVHVLEHLLSSRKPEVRIAAARALLARHDRAVLARLRRHMGQNEPRELQALALVAALPPQIAEVAATASWGFAAYRAWLAQGDRERAGRWLLGHVAQLPAPLQLDAMCEWLAWSEAQQ